MGYTSLSFTGPKATTLLDPHGREHTRPYLLEFAPSRSKARKDFPSTKEMNGKTDLACRCGRQ